jgi:hypothetical protein
MNRYRLVAQSSVSNVLVDGVDDQMLRACAGAHDQHGHERSRQIAHAQGHLRWEFLPGV